MTTSNVSLKQSSLMPVIYIPHGGGPMPLLGDITHKELCAFLSNVHKNITAPKAIVIISAHWESDIATISSSPNPRMIYDYGGFPQETYEYQYPAAGQPKLAGHIASLLDDKGIGCALDPDRGYDHGTFVPLMLMYPKADIPVVQVSLLRSMDALEHIEIGAALTSLREQGVLIVGSGMSFHNSKGTHQESVNFDEWLTDTLTDGDFTQTKQRLAQWETAPSARKCHAREEHLLPLHVCFGASIAQDKPAEKVFSGQLFDKKISAFMWQ
ncbi:MAG: class III extradiol ring-cleavage dioxygenase [Paraglaciecola sp.]|uniref:DODA-type extradiol aromatic ring-opening family dioxygenase n=1 Tax=Paraglaciecola sp. TaxID=1920173 RepID=UPI003299DF98